MMNKLLYECLTGIEFSIEMLMIAFIWIFGNVTVAIVLLVIAISGSAVRMKKIESIIK